MAKSSDDLLALFDEAPLNRRYWTSFVLLALVYVLDFFDFFLIAYLMAVIGPRWHLTYGAVALIFYGSGIGAILGSLIWGSLGEVFGRKLQTITGTLICGCLNIVSPFMASARATFWGVVTITAPVTGTVCTSVR